MLWLKILLDSKIQYESLKGLINFLVCLVKKLWQNKRTLIREIPTNTLGKSCINWGLFDLNFATRNARKSIKASKNSYYSLKSHQTLSHNIGSLSGRWRHKRKTKRSKTYPSRDDIHRKPQTLMWKVFVFSPNCKISRVYRGFEELSSISFWGVVAGRASR